MWYCELILSLLLGFANMTSWIDAPAYLSLWDLMGVDNRNDMVDGLANYTSESDYNTVLDIEPTTGNGVLFCLTRVSCFSYYGLFPPFRGPTSV